MAWHGMAWHGRAWHGAGNRPTAKQSKAKRSGTTRPTKHPRESFGEKYKGCWSVGVDAEPFHCPAKAWFCANPNRGATESYIIIISISISIQSIIIICVTVRTGTAFVTQNNTKYIYIYMYIYNWNAPTIVSTTIHKRLLDCSICTMKNHSDTKLNSEYNLYAPVHARLGVSLSLPWCNYVTTSFSSTPQEFP